MTGEIQVITSEIRSAAREFEAAARGVLAASPGKDVADIPGAMPGSRSAGAAQQLSSAWTDQFKKWHDDAMKQHENLIGSADDYDAADLRADQRALALKAHGLQAVGATVFSKL